MAILLSLTNAPQSHPVCKFIFDSACRGVWPLVAGVKPLPNVLTSLLNPVKPFDLNHTTIHSAINNIPPTVHSVTDLIAQDGLLRLREKVRKDMLTYHYIIGPGKPKVYVERNTVHFLGKHPQKERRNSVFDTAMRQPVHIVEWPSMKAVGKIPVYRKFKQGLASTRKAHNGEE